MKGQGMIRKSHHKDGGVAIGLILLLCVAGIAGYVGMHHFVNTHDGMKVYPKNSFSFKDTYVDMRKVSFVALREHSDVVSVMAAHDDLRLLPGGEALERVAEMGEKVVDVLQRVDNEYEISSSLQEIGRISGEKYRELDREYDISGKAEQAADVISDQAEKANRWLQSF